MKKDYLLTDYGVSNNSKEPQTAQIQAVLDMCREEGGRIIIPAGTYYVSSLWMWSDTTLLLKSGATLVGSENCDDYEIYPVPEGVEMRSDMEMITNHYGTPWEAYRRAMISSYGQKNLAIIGETESYIDGSNCYDPNGEEGYRGPHGIYLTNCDNITLYGYTIQHSGNFMHQLDKCNNTTMRHVTCLGGSDAIHLHCCVDTLIENCRFTTGDDCIAGINMRNLTVRHCDLNTSCNMFRIGGVHILVEDCHMFGPGYYPHRMTIVKGKNDYLPREAGRHNAICLVDYFASVTYPDTEPSSDIVFRNCLIENLDMVLYYEPDICHLQLDTYLAEMTLENVTFTGLGGVSKTAVTPKQPLTIRMKNVIAEFRPNAEIKKMFNPNDKYLHEVIE